MTDNAIERAQPSAMELLGELSRKVSDPQAAIEIAKQIVELQVQQENLRQNRDRFEWEREERQAKIDFDDALRACQEKIGRIAPNRTRENNIGWADYAELDRVLRPIYTSAGFALAYSESTNLRDGKVMICATLSRSGHSQQYYQSVTPAGNSKMNAADMEASGQSRAQRYLLLKIFNIAIGIDADEKKPYGEEEMASWVEKLAGAASTSELNRISLEAIKAVHGDTGAVQQIGRAKNKRIVELNGGSHA